MNIIGAIKSGKRFKHPYWSGNDWYTAIQEPSKSLSLLQIPICYLISDDWEVEDKSVTITESQFDSVVSKLYDINSENWSTTYQFTHAFKKELGLTD